MIYNLIGWVGISLILLAYLFNTTHHLDRSSRLYHLLNLGGSALLIYDAYTRGATAFLILNIVWALIALTAITKRHTTKKRKK